jgi:hypothetical protein
VAGAAIACVLALSGCAEHNGSAGAGAQGRQPVPSQAPSVLPKPTALPITAERSPSGAQEFVKYWFDALNYATQTGDVAPLRDASAPGCSACADLVASVRNSYGDGGYLQGGAFKVRSVTAEEFSLEDRPVLDVSFDRTSRAGIAPDGQVRDSQPAASFVSCSITLAWTGNHWKVSIVSGELLPRS